MKKIISIIMTLSLCFGMIFPMHIAHAETYTGKMGDNITYVYDDATKTLTVSGSGKMYDYELDRTTYRTNSPVEAYSFSVETLVIEEGIQYIGDYAFYDCLFLNSVSIPASVWEISERAFFIFTEYNTIIYEGDEDGWKHLDKGSDYIYEGANMIYRSVNLENKPSTTDDGFPIVYVYVNGAKLKTDQPAIIYEDRTLVPLRAICEALKCEVTWKAETQNILIENVVCMMQMQIGIGSYTKISRGDESQTKNNIDVPPMIINDRTLVPARFVAEALGAVVNWNAEQKRVDINMEYDAIWDYKENIARVVKDGKYGFIDVNRNLIVPLVYDGAYDFKEGMAEVAKGEKWGYIDKTGNLVIDCVYDVVSGFFFNGTAIVMEGDTVYTLYKDGSREVFGE